MDNIIYLPTPEHLTPEQRQYWLDQAGYWGEMQEEAERRREEALRMLGMLGIERGLR